MPSSRLAAVPALLLAACAHRADVHWEGTPPTDADLIGLAPAMFIDAGGAASVRRGTAVGHVLFAGGFITEEHASGQQNVSREVVLDATDVYEGHATAWVEGVLRPALLEWGTVTTVELMEPPSPPALRDLRGSYDGVGRDNQPLPRFALEPGGLADPPEGTDVIVVPWVVRWYSHNGGWFLGQTYGTSAGARVRVFLVTHDASTGDALAWSDIDASYLSPTEFSPNTATTEDLLLLAEAALGAKLKKQVPVR